jgi:hypothetical protein
VAQSPAVDSENVDPQEESHVKVAQAMETMLEEAAADMRAEGASGIAMNAGGWRGMGGGGGGVRRAQCIRHAVGAVRRGAVGGSS